MITVNRFLGRARFALHKWQARRLIATINRRHALRKRLPQPGYDELSNPVFLGVMAAAVAVLVVDIGDYWPRFDGLLVALATVAGI